MPTMTFSERAGDVIGRLLAPLVATVAAARHARMFHPDGVVYRARLDASPARRELAGLADRLAGPALVRLSSAWWRGGRERIDNLGIAIRLRRRDDNDARPHDDEDDQDLLFATIKHPWTTISAALTTNVHDFLSNYYFAVSPFDVPGVGRARLRLRPLQPAPVDAADRADRLMRAVSLGEAAFALEVRRGWGPWLELGRVTLVEPLAVDQAELRFWPFRAGRGLEPRGAIHAMRRAAYASSQAARDEAREEITEPASPPP
jgi:hypothetical protein